MMGRDQKRVSILILNYNGRSLLEACLPSIIDASSYNDSNYEVIVIDNNSTDESTEYIKKNFPAVNVVRFKENRYLFSYNEVIKDCQSDYVLLLNNDIKVENNFIEPLVEKMKNKNMFSVMPNIRDWDGSQHIEIGNKNRINFKKGWIDWERVEDEKEGVTFFTCAGAAIYDRDKFVQLCGFDDIYYPAYVEDVDLCYRAWKRGWASYYEPRSIVYHKNGYTMNQYISKRTIQILKIRNKYLFFWKNIQNKKLWWEHIRYFPLAIIRSLIKKEIVTCAGAFRALGLVRKAKGRRNCNSVRNNELTDIDIFNVFKK